MVVVGGERPVCARPPRWSEYPDGRIIIRHDGADLAYRLFDKERRFDQAAVVENKFFGPLLAQIRENQISRDAGTRPRRSIRPASASSAR